MIIEKTLPEDKDFRICWRIELERILYGEHEGETPQVVINPNAANIHVPGSEPGEIWRTSPIRR